MNQDKKPQLTFNVQTHFLIEDMPVFSVYQRAILCHIHRRGHCWEGVRPLAKAKNMSVGSARNARKWLLDEGYIMEYHHNGKDGLCLNALKFQPESDHVVTHSDHDTTHTAQKGDHLTTQSDHDTAQSDHLATLGDHLTTHKDTIEETIKETNKERENTSLPAGANKNGTLIPPKTFGSHYQDFEDQNQELTRNGGEILGYILDACHHVNRTQMPKAKNISHYLDGEGIDSATVKDALTSPTGFWRSQDWRGKKGDKPHLSQVETAVMEHVDMVKRREAVMSKQATVGNGALFYG